MRLEADRTDPKPDGARATVRSVAIAVGVVAAAAAVWTARSILLLGFLAVLLGVVFSFPVRWLERALHRRGLAVIAVVALFGAGLAALGTFAAGPLGDQADTVATAAPRALARARQWFDHLQRASTPPGSKPAQQPAAPQLSQAVQVALPAVGVTLATATGTILVVVLAAFLVNEPDQYRRAVRRLLPRRAQPDFDELWRRVREGLRRWVGGILVSMAIMGTLTAAALALAGIDDWALLGTLTFLGTFIPYAGAVASAVPGLLVAAGQSSRHLYLALAVYLCVHAIEGYLVEPLIMRRAVDLRPALLLVGEAIFGALFGVLGVIIATPALVCLQISVELLWVERRLHRPTPAEPAAAPP